MSEAELHVIKARLRGGVLNKARRGELKIGPPVGLIYRPDGRLDLDPDAQVQVLAAQGNWRRVDVLSGTGAVQDLDGWVNSRYLMREG